MHASSVALKKVPAAHVLGTCTVVPLPSHM